MKEDQNNQSLSQPNLNGRLQQVYLSRRQFASRAALTVLQGAALATGLLSNGATAASRAAESHSRTQTAGRTAASVASNTSGKQQPVEQPAQRGAWPVQSVDTMKHSRDHARKPLTENRQAMIRAELAAIKGVGATHAAIATPYNQEFLPQLRFWVQEARKQGLNVWFRGNWCEWEGWFDYPVWMDTYDKHIEATGDFLRCHPELFADGDSFTGCPEPENSSKLGDPRFNGRREEFLRFIRQSYDLGTQSFRRMGKQVSINWFSMNGDVGRDVMDQRTVDHIGSLVTIDHYVPDVAAMTRFVDDIHRKFKCKVLIGEFGAPLPGLNLKNGENEWTSRQQATFVRDVLQALSERKEYVLGVNYWVSAGGPDDLTRIFDPHPNQPAYVRRPAADVLTQFFNSVSASTRK